MIRIFESVQRVSICNILCTIKNGGLHVVLITAIVFAVMLLNMKVIPTKFIAVIGLVMLVLIVIVGALVWSTDGKIRFVVGVILAAVFAAVFILGSMYVYKTHSTLAGISGVNTEITEVGIYVRADDSADSIEATAGPGVCRTYRAG